MTIDVGGTTIVATAGDYAFSPRDVPHSYRVGTDGRRMLFIVTPAGFENLVRELSCRRRSRLLPPSPQGVNSGLSCSRRGLWMRAS